MQKLQQIDSFLVSHFPLFVMCGLFLGLFFPETFSRLNTANIALFAFITFVNSLDGSFRDLAKVALNPLPVIVVLFLLHVIMPLAALGFGTLLFPDQPLFTMGLVLEYSIPCGISSLMWVGIIGGNMALCLSVLLLDTLLAPFVIPLTLQLLCGSVVELKLADIMGDLALMVAVPALAAMLLYQFTRGRSAAVLKPRLSLLSRIIMLLIIAINGAGCAPFLQEVTWTLALVIFAAFLLCLLGFFLGFLAGNLLRQPFPTQVTMSFNGGYRNISAGSVLAIQFFPPDVLFPVAFTSLFLSFTASVIARILLLTKSGRAWRAQQAAVTLSESPHN